MLDWLHPQPRYYARLLTATDMTPALSIRALTKTYANGFTALKGIDLDVQQGDFFALLGPNGAGKSTTIGIITSLINKTGGKVRVCGIDIDEDFAAAKSCIGLVPQEINLNIFEQPIEIVVNQAGYYGIERREAYVRAERYLKQLNLWDKRHDQARTLSGGMKRRLMIARALVHEPKLLILDEPTAGVDIEIRRSMWEFLRAINANGTTIILTTHYLEEAESLCRNIAIIDEGRLVENTSMKGLLKTLNTETFVLDLRLPILVLPELPMHRLQLIDDHTLEVQISRDQPVNKLFADLSGHGIEVLSMRNKTNRLEQLFVHLVNGIGADAMTLREKYIAFKTLLIKEVMRFARIWIQTILPPMITTALYFIIFGKLIGAQIGPMEGFRYIDYIVPGLVSDGGDHQFLCECGVLVLWLEVPAQHRGTAGLARAELSDPGRLHRRRTGARSRRGHRGNGSIAVLQSSAHAQHLGDFFGDRAHRDPVLPGRLHQRRIREELR